MSTCPEDKSGVGFSVIQTKKKKEIGEVETETDSITNFVVYNLGC